MLVSGISKFLKGGKADLSGFVSAINKLDSSIIVGRVKDVCLNTNSKLYKSFSDIGTISFQNIKNSTPQNFSDKNISAAIPLFANFKTYPLVNEFVIIFQGPSTKNPQTSDISQFYYIPLNLWNTQHFNGYPAPYYEDPESQDTNYNDVQAGNPQVPNTNETSLDVNGLSGGQFIEKSDVHPILPFAGDIIVEGRDGNSVRLGSTSNTNGDIKNNWSEGSDEGDPIMILKNGQPASGSSQGFIPITENVNEDPSSIYLTSKQKIPIEVSTNRPAVGERSTIPFGGLVDSTPKSPKSFNNSQIILSSNRLLFNTVGDSILMSSDKNIVLESNNDIGIRSTNSNVNIIAPKGNISMGQRNAQEALIKGSSYNVFMDDLLSNLKVLCDALLLETSLSATPGAATALKNSVVDFKNKLDTLLSDKVKIS